MHVISGLLRKEPFIKSGVGQDGSSTMYAVELSEMIEDWKTKERSYTNYKALFFAKTPKAVEFYNKAFAKDSFVTITAEKLKIESRDHNGEIYNSLQMENAKLHGVKYSDNAQGWGQPQAAQQQQSSPQQQGTGVPGDFDDSEIPF